MRSKEILSLGKDLLDGFKDLMDSDSGIKEGLTEAGGLLSLIGIGINTAEKIRERSQSPGQKAYASLLKFILKCMNESLKDIEEINKDSNFDKKKLIELLEPFEKTSTLSDFDFNAKWNSHYLLDNPIVNQIRLKIENYLNTKGFDSQIIRSFGTRFNGEIENKANEDNEDIKEFRKWWAIQVQRKDLVKYLEHIESMREYALNLDNTPLYKYYINHRAVWSDIKTWNWDDDKILEESSDYRIKSVKEIIEEELLKQDQRPYLVVGASFGSGKTSMARMLASLYASIALDKGYHNNYIPILVFLEDEDLRVEYKHYSLDNLLQSIIAPKDNKEASNRRILLILDGLDEYINNSQKSLIHKLDELRSRYPNIKTMITTRLEDKILDKQGFKNVDKYVRLLSFTNEQLDDFFRNYGVTIEGIQLTYERAKELNLPVEEMTTPLFAWIFSYLEMHTSPEFKMQSKRNWNAKMTKSWIFLLFFHQVIEGKYKDSLNYNWIELYNNEKKTLRKIAALKQIYGEKLTWTFTEKQLKNFKPITNNNISNGKQISSLSYFFYFRPTSEGKVLEFVHKSFKEYLLAEYYLESLLENKTHRLNIGIPSHQTMIFLSGLINLLTTTNASVQKFIFSIDTSIISSFSDLKDLNDIKDRIVDIAVRTLNSEDIVFSNTCSKELEYLWITAKTTSNDYPRLWIHRWISLYILNTLNIDLKSNKRKLADLILYSSNLIPYYMKYLNGLDLSNTNLSNAVYASSVTSLINDTNSFTFSSNV